jgi:hypothetical protein
MPFTNAPTADTYSQHTLPMCYELYDPLVKGDTRYFVGLRNLLTQELETGPGQNKAYVSKTRPQVYGDILTGAPTGVVRGTYVWQKDANFIYYFVVVGTSVYTSTGGAFTAVTTLATSASTPVGFTEYIDDVNTKKLILVDGVEGFVFTSNAAGTEITDVDFPTPHLPFPVFLDGYLFLAKTDTGDIYNSDLNDPTAWTAGSFISSELYPDDVKAIAKVNNFLLAIGSQGCEYFYDAANATASPLARQQGASLPFGTFLPYSMAVNKNTIIILANSNDGEMSLQLIENQSHKDITPTFLMPTLNQIAGDVTSTLSLTDFRGMFMRLNGEFYYVLQTQGGQDELQEAYKGPCFAYNTRLDTWVEFSYSLLATEAGQYGFPVMACSTTTATVPVTYVAGTNSSGWAFFGHFTDGAIGNIGVATDDIGGSGDGTILCQVRFPTETYGTLNRKTMGRFGTRISTPSVADFTMDVQWNDHDYNINAWTTARTLTLQSSTTNVSYPFITQTGTFRSRAFKLTWANASAAVAYEAQVDINKGMR